MAEFTIIDDGDFDTAQESGPLFFDTALLTNNLRYIARQRFMQNINRFVPLPFGSAHPTLPGYILCKEGTPDHVGNGVGVWERIYCVLPDQWDDYRTHNYNFIGFMSSTSDDPNDPDTLKARNRFTKCVMSRIHYNYYLVYPGAGNSGRHYSSVGRIPIITAQSYYFGSDPTLMVDFLNDSPNATSPTLTAYKALITAKTEIVAEDSSIDQFFGPIYQRITRYVVAQ